MSEEDKLTKDDEEAVERYMRTVDIGRQQGVKQVIDWLCNERKITYGGQLIPINLRRRVANAIASRFRYK